MKTRLIGIGARVVFHSRWPWHMHYGRVIGEGILDPATGDRPDLEGRPAWVVEWEGDGYFPERAGTITAVGKHIAIDTFHAVEEVAK